MTASFYNSCRLYTIQLFIARNFQVVKIRWGGGGGNHPYIQGFYIYFKDFTDLDFFYTDIFLNCLLRKAYVVL